MSDLRGVVHRMTPIHNIPTYSTVQFIDRQDEIRRINELVRQKQSGEAETTQALAVRCERGSGKTWFSMHLKRSALSGLKKVKTLLICLAQPQENTQTMPNEWVPPTPDFQEDQLVRLVSWVADALGARYADNPDPSELRHWIAKKVRQMDADHLLVVILDSLYDADPVLQKRIEEELFAPLLENRNVLLVLTGRGTPFNWTFEALGPNAVPLELKPFSSEFAQEQIEKLRDVIKPDGERYSLEEILTIANGYPIVIALLTRGDELETVVEVLLSPLENEMQRRMLEALSPLKQFREKEMLVLLKAGGVIPEDKAENYVYEQVRDPLIRSSLMKKQGGYIYLDENVRHVLCEYLRRCDPERWRKLNWAAYELYAKWAADPKFRAQRDYYTDLADTHKKECE